MQEMNSDKAGKTKEQAEPGVPDLANAQTASFGQTMKAVLWSFLGIRNRRAHDRETARLNPLHVVVAALLGVAVFIFALLMIVKSVVAK
jgi:uncharacterized membrane protein YhaH (DUF805 family)